MQMLRVVRSQGKVAVDPRQVLPGRGAYVHRDATCIEVAVKRGGLTRTLRCEVPFLLATALLNPCKEV
ncbi:MAG: YlxR family protein [Deltaproteobacteria bacterium]|nr:YlxR family protein [Deltaproteobacteria bacterium]